MIGSEPSFPASKLVQVSANADSEIEVFYSSMTIRQYFVAQAMAGIVTLPEHATWEAVALASVKCADACLMHEAKTRVMHDK